MSNTITLPSSLASKAMRLASGSQSTTKSTNGWILLIASSLSFHPDVSLEVLTRKKGARNWASG